MTYFQYANTTYHLTVTAFPNLPVFRSGKSSSYFPSKCGPYGGDNPACGGEFCSTLYEYVKEITVSLSLILFYSVATIYYTPDHKRF